MRTSGLDLALPPGTLVATLRRAFVVVMLLVAGVGGAGALGVAVATERVEQLSRVLTPAVEADATALQLMLDADTGVRGYLLTGDGNFLEPYERAREEVLDELRTAEELGTRAGIEADYAGERGAAVAWLEGYAAPVAQGGSRSPTPERGKELFDRFRAEHAEVTQALVQRRAEVRADARSYRAAAVPGLAVLTLVGIAFVGLVTRATVRTVAGPLERVRDVLERLRVGDHAARAQPEGPTEVRDVAHATNALADESDALRTREEEAAQLRARTRDGVRRVRDELGRTAVLAEAAEVLGTLVHADDVLVRHLAERLADDRTDDVPDARWSGGRPGTGRTRRGDRDGRGARSDRTVAAQDVPPFSSDDLALARTLARTADVVVVEDLPAAAGADASPVVRHAARLVRAVVPGAGSAVVAPVTAGGELSGLAVVAFDEPRAVTDDEAQAIQRLCDDLGRALEQSDLFERQLRLVDRLQDLDRQKTDFISTVSHELRTPLASITGYTEILLDGDAGPLPERAVEMVEVVERNARRLRALIEDLLVLSHIERGAVVQRTHRVDLDQLVHAAVQALSPQAARAGVEVVARVAPVHVTGDTAQLERVVLNLVGNAVKFTPAGGRVDVVLEDVGGAVRLVVADTGIGIPPADQGQLFERFFRASNAVAGAVPGTGLGLSIARGAVERHGGTLRLTSAVGEGTRVEVVLPAPGAAVADPPLDAGRPPTTATGSGE